MARRSEQLMADQRAISSMVRPQPRQSPVSPSSRQTLTQGVSKEGLCPADGPWSNVGTAALPSNCVLEGDLLGCLLLHPSP